MIWEGLLFWLFKGGFRVSSSAVEWYTSSYGTDIDKPKTTSPVLEGEVVVAEKLM